MSITTLVVKFGTGEIVAGGSTSFVLDTDRMEQEYGEGYSVLPPGSKAWFLGYIDPEMVVKSVKCSAGDIRSVGGASSQHNELISFTRLFTGADGESVPALLHKPSGTPQQFWYGNELSIEMDGNLVIAKSGTVPAICTMSYSASAIRYELNSPSEMNFPSSSFDGSEYPVFPILVVLYVE